jgi:hypothetical protein
MCGEYDCFMEQSEKDELIKQFRSIIHEEMGPVLDTLMEYVDGRFDGADERMLSLLEEVAALCAAICPRRGAQ